MQVVANLDPAQAAALQVDYAPFVADPQAVADRKACALKDLRAALPDAPLTDYAFGLLLEPFGEFAEGTPVAVCRTAAGTHLALFPEMEAAHGTLVPAVWSTPFAPRPLRRGGLAVTLLQELGKAVLKEVGGKAYEALFPREVSEAVKQELTKQLADLKDFLKEMRYEDLQDDLLNTRTWLRDEFGAALREQEAGRGFPAKDLYQTLAGKQDQMRDIAQTLERRISDADLKACSYLTRAKVELHAQVYTLRALLVATQIHCRNLLKAADPTYDNYALESALIPFLTQHAAATRRMVEKLREGRLGFISELKRETWRVPRTGGMGAGASSNTNYTWFWTDDFESRHAADPFRGEKMRQESSYSVYPKANDVDAADASAQAKAEGTRTQHRKDVIGLFDEYVQEPLLAVATAATDVAGKYTAQLAQLGKQVPVAG